MCLLMMTLAVVVSTRCGGIRVWIDEINGYADIGLGQQQKLVILFETRRLVGYESLEIK